MNLGRIGLWFADSKVSEQDLSDCTQHLDLWTGTIHSVMKMQGANIIVDSASHPTQDAVGLTIGSSLLSISELNIFLDFPFNDGRSKFSAPYAGIWDVYPNQARSSVAGTGLVLKDACLVQSSPFCSNNGRSERQAFEYYYHRAGPAIAGVMDVSFWKGIVLQICLSEPAAWDAMITISLLYENPRHRAHGFAPFVERDLPGGSH
jgi:hypothetical protein